MGCQKEVAEHILSKEYMIPASMPAELNQLKRQAVPGNGDFPQPKMNRLPNLDVISEKIEEQDYSQMMLGQSKLDLRQDPGSSKGIFVSVSQLRQVCTRQSQALLRFKIHLIGGSSNCLLERNNPKRSMTGNLIKFVQVKQLKKSKYESNREIVKISLENKDF